ncbi:hypothetical protein MPLB_1800032 [Mesorhizobium sp. ORS 3324]|nr:hypothetical protein MPLB_1800032 [Mesorhizobium sp. ORS 3324]
MRAWADGFANDFHPATGPVLLIAGGGATLAFSRVVAPRDNTLFLPLFNLNPSLARDWPKGLNPRVCLTRPVKTGSKSGRGRAFLPWRRPWRALFRMDRRQIGDWWRDWLTIFVHLLNQSATDA